MKVDIKPKSIMLQCNMIFQAEANGTSRNITPSKRAKFLRLAYFLKQWRGDRSAEIESPFNLFQQKGGDAK